MCSAGEAEHAVSPGEDMETMAADFVELCMAMDTMFPNAEDGSPANDTDAVTVI